MTLGTEACQPECTEISWLVTLGTEASQQECIEIRRLVTLGTESSKPECLDRSSMRILPPVGALCEGTFV